MHRKIALQIMKNYREFENLNFDLGHSRLQNFKSMMFTKFLTTFVRVFGSF